MNLKPGTLLQNGKYRIVRFINSGGFGCTYEAFHTVFEEKVAIKEFFVKDFCNRDEDTYHVTVGTHSKKALVEKLKNKFIEEAKSIRKLHHNGIVKVSDVFEENGTAYYVMDYIEGRSLKEVVEAEGKLSETEALRYIRQVSDTLKYVHSKNMLHLDIKPGNIMIDKYDTAILIDFGISKQYDEVDGENTSTLLGKTPGYAPLEQYKQGGVSKFTPVTDIYAIGATLYKLVTGITPPEADEIYENGISFTEDMHLSEIMKGAVAFAMQPRRKDRPQSIEEFLNAFDKSAGSPKSGPSDDSSNIKKTSTSNEETVIETSERKNEINGHEYVDLGLPSGLKWATCNVGASRPEEYGDYFAWGEVEPKEEYTEENYRHFAVKRGFLGIKRTEYEFIGDDISGTEYDAARANWGGSWRLPTKAELKELVQNCTWSWTAQGGKRGYKVTGPNGNSIFLPAAGYRCGSSLSRAGGYGSYWSSTPFESDTNYAYRLYCDSSDQSVYWFYRYYGRSVRPVSE